MTFASFAGICTGILSIIGVIAIFINVGKYQGRTDQRLDSVEKRQDENEKKVAEGSAANQTLATAFAAFTGEMRATMKHLQGDISEIKSEVKRRA